MRCDEVISWSYSFGKSAGGSCHPGCRAARAIRPPGGSAATFVCCKSVGRMQLAELKPGRCTDGRHESPVHYSWQRHVRICTVQCFPAMQLYLCSLLRAEPFCQRFHAGRLRTAALCRAALGASGAAYAPGGAKRAGSRAGSFEGKLVGIFVEFIELTGC